MKTAETIHEALGTRFKARTNKAVRSGSVIDLIHAAVSEEMEDAYIEIENNKNPHIYTNMDSDSLDKTGFFVNVPRETGETDKNYLYRIMNWTCLKAASNLTAINDSLLNMETASNAQYFPGIYGAGTGIVYVIPKTYDTSTISKALEETKERLKNVIDPAAYTEYVVPTIKPIKFVIKISSEDGDIDYIKTNISSLVRLYVNSIAPKEYLSVGSINKIGESVENVDYFNVLITYIDGETKTDLKFLQNLETKFMFDEIVWEEE